MPIGVPPPPTTTGARGPCITLFSYSSSEIKEETKLIVGLLSIFVLILFLLRIQYFYCNNIIVHTCLKLFRTSRWRPHKADKRMVLEYTHGLFIT